MPMSPHDAAHELFARGRMAQAEQAWRGILDAAPADPVALHMLGYILAITGRAPEGLGLLDRSIEAQPRNAAMLSNRAAVLESMGRIDAAVRDARLALDLEPGLPAPHNLLGNIHLAQGRLEEAVAAYRSAIAADPRLPDPHVGLGLVAMRRGESDRAWSSLNDALARDPGHAAAHYNMAVLLEGRGDLAQAEQGYVRALKRNPRDWRSLNNLGTIHRRLGREADARDCFERGAALAPGDPDILNNLGISLQRADRADEAIDRYARAVEARPGFAQALVNWGNALQDKNQLDGARERYEAALAARPAFPEARYGLAQVALRQRRFAEGWPLYEARFETRPPFAAPREFTVPRADAASLRQGRRLAVWMEQGLGDQLLFSTLLPELESRSIEAVVEIDARLGPALRRRFPRMRFTEAAQSAAAFAGCDLHVPMGSLPLLFRTEAASFSRQPRAVLTADSARQSSMVNDLGPGRWIGVAWRSTQPGDREAVARRKSIPLAAFAELAALPIAGLVDLQYGEAAAEREAFEKSHPGRLRSIAGLDTREDIEGVLAAIAACERIVTSSNVLAHLAGALGKATLLLQLEGRETFHYWVAGPDGRSPWYPSVEICTGADWPSALREAARRI